MLIPAGTYMAKAVEWDFGTSGTGKEQVAVLFAIADGEHQGTRLTWYGYFHEQAARERSFKALRAAGWTGKDLFALEGMGTLDAQIVVEHDSYQGKVRAKIAWVNSVVGLALNKRMSEGEKRAFAAKMRGELLAFNAKAPAPAPAPPPATASSGTQAPQSPAPTTQAAKTGWNDEPPPGRFDDEIPF